MHTIIYTRYMQTIYIHLYEYAHILTQIYSYLNTVQTHNIHLYKFTYTYILTQTCIYNIFANTLI